VEIYKKLLQFLKINTIYILVQILIIDHRLVGFISQFQTQNRIKQLNFELII